LNCQNNSSWTSHQYSSKWLQWRDRLYRKYNFFSQNWMEKLCKIKKIFCQVAKYFLCYKVFFVVLHRYRVSFERFWFPIEKDEKNHFWPNALNEKLRMRDSYTNPSETKRIESFEIFGLTNRIHETNFLKIASRNESTKRIFWK
jgi:hypothetical protein